ncbi:hypothetical protein ONS95_005357 [Cadophora gregata]|uniref:uncharacterized protein n=1 Tax=Cadophora gregata TaxID=51156 RepID=UPI0026DA9CE7|nr:uncharacterized protein ONS95_005357 [Cadophora gregata]KAK0103328.1 hypothetical protein ONS95_005357 [Cadophora gregata]
MSGSGSVARRRLFSFFRCVVCRCYEKLAHWLYGRPVFGASDKIIEDHTEAWCIAKLRTLVGPLGPSIDYQPYKDEFELAEQLVAMEMGPKLGKLIKVGTLRQELQSLSGPSVSTQLLDFIDYLLVVDMARRPTSRITLEHPYLLSI